METPEVDFLKFQRKVNTLLGMPFYVCSMNKLGQRTGEIIITFHQFFTEMIVIIVTIGQFWAVPHIYEDMNVLCGCLSSSAHSSQVIAKVSLLKKCKSEYLTHIKTAYSLQKKTDQFENLFLQRKSDFANYHKKQSKYINVIVLIQLLVNFVSTSAYFLPFVYDSIVNEAEVQNQLTPIVVYIPTDFNYTPLFQVVVVTLTIGFYVVNLKTVVIDNFVLSLIVFHMSQLKYHNKLLKEVIQKQVKNGGGIDKDLVRAWIKQHQALSSVCNDFRKLISPYLFIEFSYILIHTCVPAFVITSTFSWTLPQKVAVFCMVGGGLVELFLMSSAGGVFSDTVCILLSVAKLLGLIGSRNITDSEMSFFESPNLKIRNLWLMHNFSNQWLSIGNDLFQSEYVQDEKWMKHVFIIVQQKIQNPFRLSAFNIIPLNRGTFASILRLIFSYYMTLNQIQKIKRYD